MSSKGVAREGFLAFDAALSAEQVRGSWTLRSDDAGTLLAGLHHAHRRLLASRPTVVCAPESSSAIFADVAAMLGVLPTLDVPELAQALANALGPRGALLAGAPRGPWDEAVGRALAELVAEGGTAFFVRGILGSPEEGLPTAESRAFDLSLDVSAAALSSFWEAAVVEARRLSLASPAPVSLADADAWWTAFSSGVAGSRKPAPRASLEGEDERLWRRLALVGRALPRSVTSWLAPGSSATRVVAAGCAILRDGKLTTTEVGLSLDQADEADLRAAGAALLDAYPGDPFAVARAAELLARAGDVPGAEVAHVRCIAMAEGTAARSDLWARWSRVVDGLSDKDQVGCRLRGAELALARGDVDVALEWAQDSARLFPGFSALLLVGKASLGRGDLIAARVSLERALAAGSDALARTAAQAELAEVAYMSRDLDSAKILAEAALSEAGDVGVRLRASNTLGKLLLSAEAWDAAERHFADDQSTAACAGDSTAELRARLNRAIAVLSDGRLGEARDMLSAVLLDGEQKRDDRAVARALMNLAVMAINAQEYGEALSLSERAIAVRRRLGERVGLAWIITNLAELRLRLGLVDEAEQAITFGRSALSAGDAAGRGARFSMIRARILLLRGDTLAAAREVAAGHAQKPDTETTRELHELSVRIALADGDVARASDELAVVTREATTDVSRATMTLLRAEVARARGEAGVLPLVREAVTAAQRAQHEELLGEAHALGAAVARAEGDETACRLHLSRALASRDRIAQTLPERVRVRYLARPELAALAELGRAERSGIGVGPPPTTGQVARPDAPRGSGPRPTSFKTLAGRDPAMRALGLAIVKIARSDGTVLIQGESGTGKELVAEAIHAESRRANAPLVKVNCAALVESLLLSELFGHEKGAFTGAMGRRRGRFEAADGGTLFLEEIGDISPATQVALLRVLQERTFERVGGTAPIHADVRIVCATHRDLAAMVERGEFRKDLYFRLSGLQLTVPSLRSRTGDLPAIADALLDRFADERGERKKSLSDGALSLLVRHRWPGNVRELENALRAASVFADGEILGAADFTEHVEAFRVIAVPAAASSGSVVRETVGDADVASTEDGAPIPDGDATATDLLYAHLKAGGANLFDMKRQIERDCIARALSETRGNITRAASILGMKRPRLSQLVKQYGLGEVSLEGS